MWVETILSREDLAQLLVELLPTKVRLGENDDWLALYDLGEVTLVPGAGLRVACKATLRWEIAGVGVPITINALTVLLRPKVLARPSGEVLSFGLEIEHADLANVPEFIDGKITDRVNRELAGKQNELAWDFTTALSRVVPIPPYAEPVDAIDVKVAWAKIRIDADALVIAISFHAHLLRGSGQPAPTALVRTVTPAPLAAPVNTGALWVAGGLAFLSGLMVASSWGRR